MPTEVIIALALILIICIASAQLLIKYKKKNIREAGYDPKTLADAGMLIGGHPDIDKVLSPAVVVYNNVNVAICNGYHKPQAFIPKSQIKNILFEDASTFGSRVSAGRLLLTGVLAFAWRKKVKNSNAYVIIEWNDGKFDHNTSFAFEGEGSLSRANTMRNVLIRSLR